MDKTNFSNEAFQFLKSRETILHIGRHKSGTSSLQRVFHHNKELLGSRGVLYPRNCRKSYGHHEISLYFHRQTQPDSSAYHEGLNFLREIEAEIEDFEGRVLLSSEGFQGAKVHEIARHFDPEKLNIIVYIREHLEYAVSSYCQAVHAQNLDIEFDDYLMNKFNIDYRRFLKAWKDLVPNGKLHVRLFDRNWLKGGDVVTDFFEVCGIDQSDLVYNQQDGNPSIGGTLLIFKRALNRLPITPLQHKKILYPPLSEVASTHERFREKPTVSQELASAYAEKVREEQQQVGNQYFGDQTIFESARKSRQVPLCSEAELFDDFEEIVAFIKAYRKPQCYDLLLSLRDEEVFGTDPHLCIIREMLA